MPLRGDFDLEYDNDAEVVIADMDFQEGEHSTETELKLKILEIYNAKLDERERRKAFVIERGLLDYKRLLAIERRRPKDEREVYDAFRPFARFNTPQEHEDLVRGVILEQRLRKRIAQLQEYRRNGIRSLAEAHEYDVLKRKRDLTSASKKQNPSFPDRKTTGGGGGGGDSSQVAAVASASANDDKGRRSSAVGGKRKRDEQQPSSSSSSSSSSSKAPFIVAGLPGADLLSDKEKSLCEALRLLPSQYQQIKATVVNIALSRGYVKRSDAAGKLVHIDAAKIGGVYDFVVSAGWVAAPRLEEGE
jgi:transcriptional adapter 2-alpha